MKNAEKFKTAEERAEAFNNFCNNNVCQKCFDDCMSHVVPCLLKWLDLDEEEPLPCPFCGSPTVVTLRDTVRSVDNYCIECTNCNYRSEEKYQRNSAISAHNSVARAVMEAGKKEKK